MNVVKSLVQSWWSGKVNGSEIFQITVIRHYYQHKSSKWKQIYKEEEIVKGDSK